MLPVLAFYRESDAGKPVGQAIGYPHTSYLHELMPAHPDEVFDCEGDE